MRRAVVAAAAAAALAAACTSPPPAPAPGGTVAVTPGDPRLEAQARAARGDWAGAVAEYRRALAARPNDPSLHFALGSALSHLDRVTDAAEEFAWVVNHVPANTPEGAAAREWLVQAGLLAAPEASRGAEAASPATANSHAGDDEMRGIAYGSVRGTTKWPDWPDSRTRKLDLVLTGDDDATRGKRYPLHILLGQPYQFNKIPAGAWRLLAKSGTTPLWETRVIVEPSTETVFDLTPEQSKVRPGQLPPR